MTYYTTDHQVINIRRIENFECLDLPCEERGFIIDACIAEVNGVQAGYLTIGYIPKDKFDRLYPDLFHYFARDKHKWPTPSVNRHADIDWYFRLAGLIYGNHYVSTEKLEYTKSIQAGTAWKPKELKRKILALEKNFIKRHNHLYESFRDFHRDKPHVDFIRVFDSFDFKIYGNDRNDMHPRDNRIDFQRRGIGSALYEDGARWMAERGLRFYASGLQQPEAEAAWDKMRAKGIVKSEIHLNDDKTERIRYYLDETSFPDEVLNNDNSDRLAV